MDYTDCLKEFLSLILKYIYTFTKVKITPLGVDEYDPTTGANLSNSENVITNRINSAMFFVLLAGLIWSFGPLVVRNMDNAELVPWQYSLIRGSAIFIILNLYLFLTEGSKFTNNYNKIGLSK